ncbi:MAG: DUF4202 family protein [Myxococcota bacterium]
MSIPQAEVSSAKIEAGVTFGATTQPSIAGVRLVFLEGEEVGRPDQLAEAFPQLEVSVGSDADAAFQICEGEWRLPIVDFGPWDRTFREAALAHAHVTFVGGARLVPHVAEVLTRYQRHFPRRNGASNTPEFETVLARHAELHDLSKPLVSADFDHALDVWQWTLRLEPRAGLPLQVAALFHDIERLQSEAEQRIEQHAPDYQAFKDAHARGGARFTNELLESLGLDAFSCRRVTRLIELHERPYVGTREPEASVLADADALSFFTLNSPGFVDYYGSAHALAKVAYSLGRMTPRARRWLGRIKLRADVRALLDDVLAHGALASRSRPS